MNMHGILDGNCLYFEDSTRLANEAPGCAVIRNFTRYFMNRPSEGHTSLLYFNSFL